MIAEGVTKLDDGTFYGLETLRNVTVESPTPIAIASNVFPNRSYSTLYCPNGGKFKYMEAEYWKEFQNIVAPQYTLTYKVDGEDYKIESYDFEAPITPIEAPTKEGYTFSGWSEIPATMPHHDVTVTGQFTRQCPAPTVSIEDGKVKFSSTLEGVTYHYSYELAGTDARSGEGDEVELQNKYKVTVYASKEGYKDSDKTVCEVTLKTEKIPGDVNGDGKVDIVDVTTVIDMILKK